MTNLELLKHLIGKNADVSDERLLLTLELLGLNGSNAYDPNNRCLLYQAAISEIQQEKGIKEVTEGGYKISYSDGTIPGVLAFLASESGCKELQDAMDSTPKVRNASNFW